MKTTNYTRILIGIIIIALGIGALLEALHIIKFGDLLSNWWPIIFVLFSILSLATNPRRWLVPTAIIILSIFAIIDNINDLPIDFWALAWPTLLIAAGVSFLFGAKKPVAKELLSKITSDTAIFSGVERSYKTDEFAGGEVIAVFGGVDINLAQTRLKEDVTIDISVFCGGIDIVIPHDWNVESKALAIFGGITLPKTLPEHTNHTLTITGNCYFGGVEVKR